MNSIKLAALLVIVGSTSAEESEKKTKSPKPNFTIGKDTTHVEGPVGTDGYLDYQAAMNDFLGKGIKPETNANVLIWKALGPTPYGAKERPAEFWKLLGTERPAEKGDYFLAFKQFASSPAEADEFGRQRNPFGKEPWTAETYPSRAKWLKANEKPLKLLVEATQRKHYFSPVVPSDRFLIHATSPSAYPLGDVVKALAARAMFRLAGGRTTDSWEDILTCHRLGLLLEESGPLNERLSANGIVATVQSCELAYLQHARLDAKQAHVCLKDLSSLYAPRTLARQVNSERLFILESVMRTDEYGFRYLDQLRGLPGESKLSEARLTGAQWDSGLRKINEWYDRYLSIVGEEDRAVRERRFKEFEREQKDLRSDHLYYLDDLPKEYLKRVLLPKACGDLLTEWILMLQSPAIYKVQQGIDRTEQFSRNILIAYALASFKLDREKYPKTIEELTPDYLAKIPLDLYSGKAVIYRPDEKGFLLYSVGPNGKDDGGDPATPGVFPATGDAAIIRMPPAKSEKK
jgi:hypothetical protein